MSGISIIWDKQFGFIKELLVAPSSRKLGILGRVVGDSIVVSFQGLLLLLLSLILAREINILGILPTLLVGFLLSMTMFGIGISLALKMGSQEGFQLIMNFITMPLLFLSGAFYPVNTMPEWMKYLSYIDPLTYAVDASRHFLIGVSNFSLIVDLASLIVLSGVFLGISILLFEKATID